jgi:hypothetical protein
MVSEGSESAPLVAISILNQNEWRDTISCPESVRHLDYPDYLAMSSMMVPRRPGCFPTWRQRIGCSYKELLPEYSSCRRGEAISKPFTTG